ncbi:MAG: hypothetical protein IKX48_15430, partial [Victivallales bacterium]|nr:hypothetical protein [Victivallales bacterium]
GMAMAAIPIESSCNARIGDDYNCPIFKAADAKAVAEALKNSYEHYQVAMTSTVRKPYRFPSMARSAASPSC